jgi:hypothetical protein
LENTSLEDTILARTSLASTSLASTSCLFLEFAQEANSRAVSPGGLRMEESTVNPGQTAEPYEANGGV